MEDEATGMDLMRRSITTSFEYMNKIKGEVVFKWVDTPRGMTLEVWNNYGKTLFQTYDIDITLRRGS